jgi:hypothetical protein
MAMAKSWSNPRQRKMPGIVRFVTDSSLATILIMLVVQVQGGALIIERDALHPLTSSRLISIMLSRLRMNVDDTIEEYERLAGFIFGHPRIFSIRGPIPFPPDGYSSKQVVEVIQHVVLSRLCGKDPSMGQDLFASHQRMCKT